MKSDAELRSFIICSNDLASVISAILLCAFCLQVVGAADVSVVVNPSSGVDSSSCGVVSPCKTIAYAIQSRNATMLYLAAGYFNESSVIINGSVAFVSITGSNGGTVFDCSRSSSSGPAFSITNTSVSISRVTFQNCANFNVSKAVGGAVSASGSSVTVSDCIFLNNAAQTGGAIGVTSSSLAVSSCVFENNTATCPNAASTSTACSAWGGAIGTVEAPSVSIANNTFSGNLVNLVLNGVTGAAIQAVAGGGCVSVLYNLNVSESRVTINGNALQNCSVRMFGFNDGESTTQGIQYGNTYGGAVSLYYGLKAVSSLVVNNVSSAFTNNQCRSSGIASSVGIAGNAYGGCLSVHAGAWNVGTILDSSMGLTSLSRMTSEIRGNTIYNCSAQLVLYVTAGGSDSVFGANVYGGGMSLAVGAYSYSYGSSSSSRISGSTTVSNTSYTISNNTLTGCYATSSTLSTTLLVTGGSIYGANVYGGGMSFAVGAYSYSQNIYGISSIVSGSTTVTNTRYTISSNTVTGCNATSSSSDVSSLGANVYGGGMSLAVGAYSYGPSSSRISGSTTVSNTSYTISNNTLTACIATSTTLSMLVTGGSTYGTNVYGGGISLAVGPYSYSQDIHGIRSSVSGSTTVTNTSYTISSNTLTTCNATSSWTIVVFGANVYGGGMSFIVGAYSYSQSGDISNISGSTLVCNTIYYISSNTLTNCFATLLFKGVSSALGANVYGGGIALTVGPYSYGPSSRISGSTTVSNTSYTISSNTLIGCFSSSMLAGTVGSFYGANVYGGGMSLAVGPYSYSQSEGSNEISGSTLVTNTSYTISSNTLTGCCATSSISFGSFYGANVYGGGMSLAVGAYSYSQNIYGISSSISGSTTVSNTSYTISSNTLTGCNATSSLKGVGSALGVNVYGGGMSLAVGAYSYSHNEGSISVSGSTTVSNTRYTISSNTLSGCNSLSQIRGSSIGAAAYGGGISVVHNLSSYPVNTSSFVPAIGFQSVIHVNNCSLWNCTSMTSSETCASGSSNAAGGAVFFFAPSLAVDLFSSSISSSSADVQCAASASSTYSLGGGLSIFQAGNVTVTSTYFTSCFAQGVPQATNVFVSGGGLHVQASGSLLLQNCLISNCGILNAFSSFLQGGGGALSTQNVSSVRITGSSFRDNVDSSSTGTILLQQLDGNSAMNVVLNRSVVSVSSTPALSISCGSKCSVFQQQLINVNFQDSTLSSYYAADSRRSDSSAIMSLPNSSHVHSENSSLKCIAGFFNNVAVRAASNPQFVTFSCAPCERPFEIALTSSTLRLNNFHDVANMGEKVCQNTALNNVQQCPYGLGFCFTVVNVSVGFWASFTADGRLSNATRCPQKYCGCKNIERFNGTTCQLIPPLDPGFQSSVRSNDNMCNGNRSGVLCGGCKPGFTQSLDGYSCISNDVCLQNIGWVWAVTAVGYVAYSIYIVFSSLSASKLGLTKCALFYGQMSTFAQLSTLNVAAAGPSSAFLWLPRALQFESIALLYSETCFGTDIDAYSFTAMQLSGPAIVLIFSSAFAFVIQKARPCLLRHNIDANVSVFATLSHVILLIFSSVATVVFKLITCSKVAFGDVIEDVVFIDGTVKCYDERWKGLVAVVVVLCLFPFMFVGALRSKRLPHNVQTSLCGAYSESRFYWSAVTLLFRLVMSIVHATIRSTPSTAALIQSFLCVAMLVLLVRQKPYRSAATQLFDILCHAILVIQYGLVAISTVPDSLGFIPSESNLFFDSLNRAAVANSYLRLVPFIVCAITWLYLHRTAISDKMVFAYRSLKGIATASFHRMRRPAARSAELSLGNSVQLKTSIDVRL